jgi:hypothetical protein
MADLGQIRKITKTSNPIRTNELIALDDTLMMSDHDFALLMEMLESMADKGTMRLKVYRKV